MADAKECEKKSQNCGKMRRIYSEGKVVVVVVVKMGR